MTVYQGDLIGTGLRVGIVVARFNEMLSGKLLSGARDALLRHGVDEQDIDTVWVPGSFEIPPVARRMAGSGRYAAVITLGVVIRGATPHFEYVAAEVSKGVARCSFETGVPVIYGIVTADTIEQAVERSGTKAGNRGWDAALAAIEMAKLHRALPA